MIKLDLPFWLSGVELTKLKKACQAYWNRAENWLKWPLLQLDVETCPLDILNLIAYQRDITRFKGEPERLYRLRVKYAYINAKDAGSVAGFIRIFERLEIGYVELEERQPGRDWDIITLILTDSQVAKNHDLLMNIIYQYGRTCRRYEFSIITPVHAYLAIGEFNNDTMTLSAQINTNHYLPVNNRAGLITNDSQTLSAKL